MRRPVEKARELADSIPEASLTVLPNARHLTPIERPQDIAAAIEALISQAAICDASACKEAGPLVSPAELEDGMYDNDNMFVAGDIGSAEADRGVTVGRAAILTARFEALPFTPWHRRARIVMGSATLLDAFDALSLAFVLPILISLWSLSPARSAG